MEIAAYKINDEKKILILFKKVFSIDMTLHFWKWRFQNQPLKETHIELMWDGDSLAGHYAICPIEFLIMGNVNKASLSLTTMTDPNYGGQGIFPKLANSLYAKLKNQNHTLIYGFPNTNSHYGFVKKLNWKNVALIPTFKLFKSSFNEIHNLSKIKSCGDKLEFDSSHYNAFLEISKDYNFKVNRTIEYLNWRYKRNPSNNYEIFEHCVEGNTYYAITKLYKNTKEETEVDLVELIFPNDQDILSSLFSLIFDFYKTDVLNTWIPLSDVKHITLEKLGFENKLPLTYLGYRPFNEGVSSLNEKDWYFSMGDSDTY